MLFGNKNKEEKDKCDRCGSKVSMRYKFCPHCGHEIIKDKISQKESSNLKLGNIMKYPLGKI